MLKRSWKFLDGDDAYEVVMEKSMRARVSMIHWH
jgi:hypothetical protein